MPAYQYNCKSCDIDWIHHEHHSTYSDAVRTCPNCNAHNSNRVYEAPNLGLSECKFMGGYDDATGAAVGTARQMKEARARTELVDLGPPAKKKRTVIDDKFLLAAAKQENDPFTFDERETIVKTYGQAKEIQATAPGKQNSPRGEWTELPDHLKGTAIRTKAEGPGVPVG